MAAARLHPSLPAPVVHSGFSVSQSKSHVLAGVQDAYWSDDEAEDAECPLCLEEMDVSDLGFKPCVCGYQICRFCWHHIKENLNKRCPACRRIYTDEAVEFKAIDTQDHRRLMQQKKQRERERKELDTLGRRHLANVRVVQRHVVYVVGIGPRFAKEELIPTLRSNEYFGQYGKINKIILVKRTPSGGGAPVVGLYVTYNRKEDAARAMSAVDGIASPGGGKEVMRASYGTTKYCMAFLRGSRLPRAASWAQKPLGSSSGSGLAPGTSPSLSRPPRRGGTSRQSRAGTGQASEIRATQTRSGLERKSIGVSLSQTPASRSSTPPFGDGKSYRKETSAPKSTNSPAPSANAGSDAGSHLQEQGLPLSSRPSSPGSNRSPMRLMAHAAATAPAVPPGLVAPPGIRSPAHPSRVPTASPQTPLLSLQSSYQMSTAARALLDDVKARRESSQPAFGYSPFPDFDRTLQALGGGDDGGFSFNLDPKLADEVETSEQLDDFNPDTVIPFTSPYMDSLPGLQASSAINSPHLGPPPGLSYPTHRSVLDSFIIKTDLDSQNGHSYMGSFNPFADSSEDDLHGSTPRTNTDADEERKHSRFNFARGRHGSNLASPSNTSGPNFHSIPENSAFYSTATSVQPPPWSSIGHQEFNYPQVASNMASPLLQQSQPQNVYPPNMPRFQPFETDLSEAQLRDFIQSSRERANVNNLHSDHQAQDPPGLHKVQQPFHDPAIMSASFAPQTPMSTTYGPPPGLAFPPGLNSDNGPTANSHVSPIPPLDEGSTHGEFNFPLLQGREANLANVTLPHYGNSVIGVNALFNPLVAQTQ
ncbi:hypothetical protein AGABI2DRAFT_64845 [Agaricus bisporus var. bisporus H97]|uniref:hypothetical protein n=1 Tax=Agaricus bisporus var. bisporus (strain H97 / ATCC MYA-4626 / FGSC 10389) TaxID=936046 RepID=UPI00029F63FD|nr:hypothetical protein AGABI2DRAFT_64845 [Agaricus bisporus var. bisporus H97]EKV50185.1 hypothetical protein AGABI2DRAFT_64845 [Agaricus bisporus var. bisporus H97]